MTLEEAIRGALISDTAVAGIVGERIYAERAILKTEMPCIVYSTPDSQPDEASYTLEGPAMWRTRIVLSALGRTSAEAHAVADAIYSSLGPYQGQRTLGSVRIEALHFENLQDEERDPDSGNYRFDRTMEILQT